MLSSLDWGIVAACLIGYVLGSIPFGMVTTRLGGKGDVREIGSGNIGATNVLRTGSKSLAALTLVGDMLKGTVAVLAAASLIAHPLAPLAAGFCAFLGHLFPVWLGFKGGKGVATYLGVLIGLDWRVALAFAIAWLAVAAVTRLSSLSALLASLVAPLAFFVLGHGAGAGLLLAAMSAILWWRHRDNIQRLLAGEEGRIGESS